MVRGANKKRSNGVPRDPAAYLDALQARLRILKGAAERWDESRDRDEVIVMALALRTLLGDNDRLVDRVLSIKRAVLFIDTSLPEPEVRPDSEYNGVGGLTMLWLGPPGSYVAPVCHLPRFDPDGPYLRFEEWWRRRRPVRADELAVTREFLVTEVADTDGVHVDELLDPEYLKLRGNLRGFTFSHPDGQQRPVSGVAAAAIRQIAWETERSVRVALASRQILNESLPQG